MKYTKTFLAAALTVGALMAASTASATTYVYVGSWTLGDGPFWADNPPVYSGVETAALLFGGSASDYVTSTVDSNPADINFSTWLDGWADATTYALSGNPAPDTYSLDTGGGGYNSDPGFGTAYSAYVADHFNPAYGFQDPSLVNYAFKAVVPETSTWSLMILGVFALGGALRSRRKGAVATA